MRDSSAGAAAPSGRRRRAADRTCGLREAALPGASDPGPGGRRRARGRAPCSFRRPQAVSLIAKTADSAMDQELDGARGLAHRDRDVLDLHVLLELQNQRRLLLDRQSLDQPPDPPDLVAMGGLLLERRARDREVV